MSDDEFWQNWADRFHREADSLITPDHQLVRHHASNIIVTPGMSKEQRAIQVWKYIAENIAYQLSEEWKPASKTIKDRRGDCEDVDFLFMSLAPHVQLSSFKMQIGNLTYPDKSSEAHTWIRIGDNIIDPTAYPQEIAGKRYKPKQSMQVNVR